MLRVSLLRIIPVRLMLPHAMFETVKSGQDHVLRNCEPQSTSSEVVYVYQTVQLMVHSKSKCWGSIIKTHWFWQSGTTTMPLPTIQIYDQRPSCIKKHLACVRCLYVRGAKSFHRRCRAVLFALYRYSYAGTNVSRFRGTIDSQCAVNQPREFIPS